MNAPRGPDRALGFGEGDVGRLLATNREAEALALARDWQQLFGDRYYLELQRLGRPDDETLVARSVALSHKSGIPVVATNDVRFLAPSGLRVARGARMHRRGPRSSRILRGHAGTRVAVPAFAEEMAQIFADIPKPCRTRWKSPGAARCR
jgi:DNA polymerase-3 subunit alpha